MLGLIIFCIIVFNIAVIVEKRDCYAYDIPRGVLIIFVAAAVTNIFAGIATITSPVLATAFIVSGLLFGLRCLRLQRARRFAAELESI